MKRLKTSIMGVFVLICLLSAVYDNVVNSQSKGAPPTGQANVALSDDDIQRNCPIETEATICNFCPRPREAPTGFDDLTNGFKDPDTHKQNRITFW